MRMRTILLFSVSLFVLNSCLFAKGYDYPKPEKSGQVDEYFGTKIPDPYRWMEDNSDPRLKPWIEAENKLTESYLETIPFRNELKNRLSELVDYPRHSIPWTKTGRRYFFKNDGLQNQSVLYVIDKPGIEPRTLLDPNKLSDDGTVSLQSNSISGDGQFMAYSIARSGSDWNEIHVMKIENGEKLSDHLKWVKFSGIAWFKDGFFYSGYDTPPAGEELTAKNEFHKICYHRLGTSQDEDVLVYRDSEHALRNCGASTDRDENWLFLSTNESTYGNTLAFLDLSKYENGKKFAEQAKNGYEFIPITETFDSELSVSAVIDGKFYVHTDRKAPNCRLLVIDPAKPEEKNWTDLIPESDSLLEGARHIAGKLVVTYLKDAAHEAFVYGLDGKRIREIELPTLGICGFSGERDQDTYFQSFTSFTYPTVIYECSMSSGERKELFPSEVKFNPGDFETERIWYENSARKKVPVFVVYKKGLKKDGNNPTLLYGYGGFNISMRPGFSVYRIPFLEKGGVYAMAVLRGGGEYGETWHKSGTKLQKQNVFDDFAAAGEELIAQKFTSPKRLAIQGGSNGGLLVGASITQRPDLFRAGVAAVGVLDMLRYQKFTIGWAWATDYGTSEESKEMFEYLLGYSPLHNIKPGIDYPALLVTTSDHDDRVVPAHSFKFIATMQEKSTSKYPAYIRIETKAGHGAGKPISKVIEEQADVWSFLLDQLTR